jgi:hypothetical protein
MGQVSTNLLPPKPWHLEPVQEPDDGAEYAILDRDDEHIVTVHGRDDMPGSAREVADLIVQARETRP